MCILDPEFFASCTTIIDVRHNDTKRELIYMNKLEPVKSKFKHTDVKMLFHISGPLIDVKTDDVDTLINYKNTIDDEFSKFEKGNIQLDCDECDGIKKFETESYNVQSFPLNVFEKDYMEILKSMDTSEEDIKSFIDNSLPAIIDNKSAISILDSKNCHVVMCVLKKSLFDKEQIVKFIYEPIDNKIILPIMHEISPDGEYKYDVKCFIDNVSMDNKKMDEIHDWMADMKINRIPSRNIKEIHETCHGYYSLRFLKSAYRTYNIHGFIYLDNNLYVKLSDGVSNKRNHNIIFDIISVNKNKL
ncbi:p35 apoptosis inhibitor [Choristoneura biennis entomopoxvirus]|uniref:P35 apoptosis inhibitor n=1 Tax=Choristoneura biennis entomopoxvirus TaxID=10288 RepID=A0A916KPD4_CBEPV|nr:p35 apoptosis inhibitor [Choristoneura biennis entomopoxvirus]CCU55595.1 p35 apoptosis inhibitor [Choristoneura biennis entomopoxvirus]